MTISNVQSWSTTAASNTDVGGTSIAEGCPPSNINDAIRALMAQVATWYDAAIVTSLTADTTPDGTADYALTYDNSAAATKKVLLNNLLYIINSLTTDSSPDKAADYVATYDASASGPKKVLLGVASSPTLGTEQASTSGTSIDFTSIPSWVKRITIMLVGVSTNGTSNPLIQIGDSGGVEATSYTAGGDGTAYTTGFGIGSSLAANVLHGSIVLTLEDASDNTWVCNGAVTIASNGNGLKVIGSKSLSAALDRVRITTVNGTDAFDAGAINILYS